MTQLPVGVLFVFLDGVGIGPAGPDNPFARRWPGLERLAGRGWTSEAWGSHSSDGVVVRSLDAGLGVPGLPQSASGQTTLLTGRNAAEVMGGHYGPWPGPTLRSVLDSGTLFHDGVRAGGAALANVYPPGYFTALSGRRARRSAIVHAALAAGLTLADLGVYASGAAVAADLDGAYFVSPAAARPDAVDREAVAVQAGRLAAIAERHAFTLFDVWATDQAGHRADVDAAVNVIARLDAFLDALLTVLPAGVTLLVTSDHGNLEDAGSKRHSQARVPLVARGPGARAFDDAASLADVAPSVRRLLATTGG